MAYDTDRLYEDAFTNTFKWDKWLPEEVFTYHDLIYKEVNAPVSLQMGCLLPFISSLCGPKTRGKFLTRDSVLNLFWINIGVSGIGKTQSRNRMISEPMQFLLQNVDHSLIDFEVSLYTRAGLADKIISSDGYCCLVTDEGSSFFDQFKKKDGNHESDMSLLNQLYDGKGDKTTLAQSRERQIPPNATCVTVSLQPESFVNGLSALGKRQWMDNGFGERFIFTAHQPYRYSFSENKKAANILNENYDNDFLGRIALELYKFHKTTEMVYSLDCDAEELFEQMFDKYNGQFNMKYSGDIDMGSQPDLDYMEKSEISVRTKAPELIGRLTCVLWIYCEAFKCVKEGRQFNIGSKIPSVFVKNAEEIVTMSYSHSETFSSAVLSRTTKECTPLSRPKHTDRSRVIAAIVRSNGPVVPIRSIAKNIRSMSTDIVRDELRKLCEEGYGKIITQQEMKRDKILSSNQCVNVYLKPDITFLGQDFFKMCSESELNDNTYVAYFNKSIDDNMKKIVQRYHPHKQYIMVSQNGSPRNVAGNNDAGKENAPNSWINTFPVVKNPKVFTTNRYKGNGEKKNGNERNDRQMNKENSDQEMLTSDTEMYNVAGNSNMSKVNGPVRIQGKEVVVQNTEVETTTDTDIAYEHDQSMSNASKKKKRTKYVTGKKGAKLNTTKDLTVVSETQLESTDDNSNGKIVKKTKKISTKKDGSKVVTEVIGVTSTEESDTCKKKFKHPTVTVEYFRSRKNKTIRWNRNKKITVEYSDDNNEKGTRKSKRIQQMKEKETKESSSSEVLVPSGKNNKLGNSRKRRLSKSQRDTLHKASQKRSKTQ